MTISLKISDSTGIYDFSSLVEDPNAGLTLSTITPGGDDRGTLTNCDFRANNLAKLGAKAIVSDELGIFWLGRVAQPVLHIGRSFDLGLQGYGYSCSDRRFESSQIFTAGSLIEDIVTFALGQLCPEVQGGFGLIAQSGIRLNTDSEDFIGQTAVDVFNSMAAITTYLATPLTWHVRPSPINPFLIYPLLDFFTMPLTPAYIIDANDIIDAGGDIELSFDIESVINRAIVTWGNKQSLVEPTNRFGDPNAIDYSAISIIRDKYVNAERELNTRADAVALAASLVQRFNKLRSTRDTITVPCDVSIHQLAIGQPNINPWRVRSGNVIRINNLGDLGPYTNPDKYIISTSYDFKTQVLTIRTGELVGLSTLIRLLMTWYPSRVDTTFLMGAISQVLPQNDRLPVFGPEFSASGNSLTAGVPIFDKEHKQILPSLIPDTGIEVNFIISGDLSLGFKGVIKTIPCELESWEMVLSDTTGPIIDSITIRVYQGWPVERRLFDMSIASNNKSSGIVLPKQVLPDKGAIAFEVLAEPANATSCSIAIKGKRTYPGYQPK